MKTRVDIARKATDRNGQHKVSVLLFYPRLVEGIYSRRWKYAALRAIAFTVAYTVAFRIMHSANCIPTKSCWSAFDPRRSLKARLPVHKDHQQPRRRRVSQTLKAAICPH